MKVRTYITDDDLGYQKLNVYQKLGFLTEKLRSENKNKKSPYISSFPHERLVFDDTEVQKDEKLVKNFKVFCFDKNLAVESRKSAAS